MVDEWSKNRKTSVKTHKKREITSKPIDIELDIPTD